MLLTLLFTLGCNGRTTETTKKNVQNSNPSKQFIISGSAINIPIITSLADAYYTKSETETKIHIPGAIGSDGAIKAVQAGNIELAVISRPLTPSERASGLKELPYARTPIIFGAHMDTPDSGFSSSEIIDILKGTKTTWSDGTKIRVFLREHRDGANLTLYDALPSYKETVTAAYQGHHWQILPKTEMTDALKKVNGAFGLTTGIELVKANGQVNPLEQVKETACLIKSLDFDGVSPTDENVRMGNYKLTQDLSFVYTEPLSHRASSFLDYVFSEEGKHMLDKSGAIPLAR